MEEQEEIDLKNITKEQIKAEMLKQGLVESPLQRFSVNGSLEQTNIHAEKLIEELSKCLKEYVHKTTVTKRILQQLDVNKVNSLQPNLTFTGIELNIKIIVPPTDLAGNNGQVWIDKETNDKYELYYRDFMPSGN